MTSNKYSFLYDILDLIEKKRITYWLEGGTALAAYRDGKIFLWEHDFDIGIWKEDAIKLLKQINKSEKKYKIVIQKNFPYLDNIIQIYSLQKEFIPNQIDIYIYTKKNEYAYMRWFHTPEGFIGKIFRYLFFFNNKYLKKFYKIRKDNLLFRLIFFILSLCFRLLITFNYNFLSARYHSFPKIYFENLQSISFCNREMFISSEAESFLKHRYGENWKTPDDNFNQSGKWKTSLARPILSMKDLPQINIELKYYEK